MNVLPPPCTTQACAENPKPATHALVLDGNYLKVQPASGLLGATLCDDCAEHWRNKGRKAVTA
jgi:hypothetical protein